MGPYLMATTAEINAHDQLMADLAQEFSSGLEPLFDQLFDELAGIAAPTRTQIAQQFLPIRQYAQAQLNGLNTVVTDAVAMNSDVLGPQLEPESASAVNRLRQEAEAVVSAQIDEEASTIINSLVLAGIAGGVSALILGELRAASQKAIARLAQAFESSVRQFDGALTLIRGRNTPREIRYKYVGGVIAESRDFCRSMNNRVMTEQEIRRIWSTQEWSGKRTGDPFITRGGYNCRHQLIPVGVDE